MAVEPTSDGVSAVVTTLISLPGGSNAPMRITFGSALVSIRGSHNILHYQYNSTSNISSIGGAWRTAIRRRAF